MEQVANANRLQQLILVYGDGIIADVEQLLEAHQGTATLTEILHALEVCWGNVNNAHRCFCDDGIAPYRTARNESRGDDASSDDDGLEVVSVGTGAPGTPSTASDASTDAPSRDAEQLVVTDARPFLEETPAEVVMADAAFVPESIEAFSAEESAVEHTVSRDELLGDDASSDDVAGVEMGAFGTPLMMSDASNDTSSTPFEATAMCSTVMPDDDRHPGPTSSEADPKVYPRGFDGQRLPVSVLAACACSV